MPRGDGRGPVGYGPMTGRGLGYCAGFQVPGFANVWTGGGRAMGGHRRGFRNMYYATGLPGWARSGYSPGWQEDMSPPARSFAQQASDPTGQRYDFEGEKDRLKQQAQVLKQQLDHINSRLEVLEEAEDGEEE